jgi:peptide chain release factor 2
MDSLSKKIEQARADFFKAYGLAKIESKMAAADVLKTQSEAPDFWQDQAKAVEISRKREDLLGEIKTWNDLKSELDDLAGLSELAVADAQSEALLADLDRQLEAWNKKFAQAEIWLLFSEKYDDCPAILTVHAGTGGVDAQDWASMLERMYLRYGENHGFNVEVLDRVVANEAGIKNVSLRFAGRHAYGLLKSENGVHRLGRISPFDAEKLRQTSFASVEVTPELPESDEFKVKDSDIKLDVFRSSGPGGQSVNTTDSAVRLTHIPTGLTVSCQTERSQRQNRESAMKILKSKLIILEEEKRRAETSQFKGETATAGWGKQIRSYMLYGNQIVKDHRTGYETSNPEAVLNGNLDGFIESYLRWLHR